MHAAGSLERLERESAEQWEKDPQDRIPESQLRKQHNARERAARHHARYWLELELATDAGERPASLPQLPGKGKAARGGRRVGELPRSTQREPPFPKA